MRKENRVQAGNLLLPTRLVAVAVLILVVLLAGSSLAFAQEGLASVRQVQAIETKELGLTSPAGLVYSPAANSFLVVETPRLSGPSVPFSGITAMTRFGDQVRTVYLLMEIVDPLNMAFDSQANRLLLYQAATRELIEVGAGPDGYLNPAMVTRHDAREFGLERPQGMAVDPASGRLYFLDSAGPRIVSVEPDLEGGFGEVVVRQVDLDQMGLQDLRGLAWDPTTGHLYVLAPVEQMLYELTLSGEVVASRDLPPFGLGNPQGMVFAPSGDLTDDPSEMSLYIADSGSSAGLDRQTGSQSSGQIVELAFDEVVPLAITEDATVVQVVDTSLFDPPSPDAAGITYLEYPGTLLEADSEVNEMPDYEGHNLFEISLSGNLVDTHTTWPLTTPPDGFSREPTGIAYDPAGNGRIFISSDDETEIYEVDLGPDKMYDLSDPRTSFDTAVYGSQDPEGVAYDPWKGVLYIVDGVNDELYEVDPGNNGIFDGVLAAGGDDVVTSWDTAGIGITDPEGIAFDPENGYLYIIGIPRHWLAHIAVPEDPAYPLSLIRTIDIPDLPGIPPERFFRPAGLTCAPASDGSDATNVWVADRGYDNNDAGHEDENDGLVYELSLPPFTPVPGVTLTPSTGAISANPGVQVTYDLLVRNTGDSSDTYIVTVTGNSWPTQAPLTVGPVAAGGLAPLEVIVSVPSNAQCGDDDVATVTVTSQFDPQISDSSVLVTTANAIYKVTSIPSSDSGSGNPGDPVVYHLQVTNTGNCPSTFDVTTSSGSWITDAPSTLGPLAPDEYDDVTVTATVPQDAECTDVDNATITFRSQEDSAASDSSQLTTSVIATYELTLTPASMALSGDPGTDVLYTFRVTNLGNCPDRYNVAVSNDDWPTDALPSIGPVAPGGGADVEVTVTVPGDAGCGDSDSASITLTSQGNGAKSDGSNLTTSANTVRSVTVTPSTASASANPTYEVGYSLWVRNTGNCSDIFDLDVGGTTWPVEIQPTQVSLAAGASANIDVTVTVPEDALCGDEVATVTATSRNDGTASDASVLTTTANAVYGVTVTPPSAADSGDPTEEVVYVLRVTNSGNCSTRYDIAIGDNIWPTESRLTVGPLEPGAGRNRDVTVTVPQDALCGEVDSATVTVTSQDDGSVSDSSVLSTSANTVYGVTVTPSSHSASADPGSDAIHTLRVTNDGNCQDTFDIAVSGDLWPTEAPGTVGPLAADAGADVDVMVDVRLCTTGGDSDTITVTSTSQHDGTESDSATLVTRANQVAPVANDDEYSMDEDTALEVEAPGVLGNDSDPNCDPRTVAWFTQPDNGTVSVDPDGSFLYTPDPNFSGDDSFTYTASDGDLTDMATVVVHVLDAGDNPIVNAGDDQRADEGEDVHFAGSFVDPARTLADGETIHWDFGDGETATGSLTSSHAYDDNGEYTVVLTITDGNGDVGQDSLVVTVDNVAPTVDAGPDQSVLPGELVSFSGGFTDPGLDDTHTIEWDLGDDTIIPDTLTFDYAYEDIGIYTVTLTVTDDDGGVGDDTVEIRVMLRTYLPIISRASQR